jgi:DNA polymerase-3 subunit gamma/tau
VEDVRDLRDKINFTPNQGRYKVYIIDEVHMLSTAAFNALLKTLEEPPSHAIFILATTEVHKIPPTVLSRCQRHEFRRLPVKEIVGYLEMLAKEENIQADHDALIMIARQATGAMRDAISLLDQLASSGEKITLGQAQTVLGTATSQAVLELVDALLEGQAALGLENIHRALDAGSDPRQFARQTVDHLRDILLVRLGNADQVDATAEMRSVIARHAQSFETPGLLRVIQAFNEAASGGRGTWQPSLPLEMAFVQSLAVLSEPPLVSTGKSGKSADEQVATQPGPATPKSGLKAEPKPVPHKTPTTISEPEQPAAQASAVEATPQDRHDTQSLSQVWGQIVNLLRQRNPNLSGLLNSCKSKHFQGGTLYLSFASDVLKGKMEMRENMQAVEQAFSEMLGREVHVKCTVDTAKRNAIPSNVDDDGMVAAALRDLGGEIVDMK